MQVIFTKFLPATNCKGSRIKVYASGVKTHGFANLADNTKRALSKTFSYEHADTHPHREAARKLAEGLGWDGLWIEGDAGNGSFVYVRASVAGGAYNADSFEIK